MNVVTAATSTVQKPVPRLVAAQAFSRAHGSSPHLKESEKYYLAKLAGERLAREKRDKDQKEQSRENCEFMVLVAILAKNDPVEMQSMCVTLEDGTELDMDQIKQLAAMFDRDANNPEQLARFMNDMINGCIKLREIKEALEHIVDRWSLFHS